MLLGVGKQPQGPAGPGGHSFWRFAVTQEVGGNFNFVYCIELEFLDKLGANIPMTGTALGTLANTSNPIANAFDSNTTTYYQSDNGLAVYNPIFLGMQFAAPVELSAMAWTNKADSLGSYPSAFNMQYSDNGTTWITARTYTGVTWVANTQQRQVFNI